MVTALCFSGQKVGPELSLLPALVTSIETRWNVELGTKGGEGEHIHALSSTLRLVDKKKRMRRNQDNDERLRLGERGVRPSKQRI